MSAGAIQTAVTNISSFTDLNAAIPVVGALFVGAVALIAAWKLIRGAFA